MSVCVKYNKFEKLKIKKFENKLKK